MNTDLEKWLRAFASAVRCRDYASARELFDAEVVSFGTVAVRAIGIDQLCDQQWRNVWQRTEGFDFDFSRISYRVDQTMAVVMSEWSSFSVSTQGERRQRRGRVTIVLVRSGNDFKAVHTHFSMVPGTDG